MFRLLAVAAALAAAAAASAQPQQSQQPQPQSQPQPQRVALEPETAVPASWVPLRRAAPAAEVELLAALRPRPGARERLDALFWQRSSAVAAGAGAGSVEAELPWLSRDEVARLAAPPAGAAAAAEAWLKSSASASSSSSSSSASASASAAEVALSPGGDVVVARLSAAAAGELLGCEFWEFAPAAAVAAAAAAGKGQPPLPTLRRCKGAQYTVPAAVAEHVELVGGAVRFPAVPTPAKPVQLPQQQQEQQQQQQQEKKPSSLGGEPWGAGVTPRFIRDLYNIPSEAWGNASVPNVQAIASFLGQYFDDVDLQEFYSLFMQELVGSYPEKVIGKQGLLPGVEANLDIQYITAVSGVRTWAYSNAGLHGGQEVFLKFFEEMSAEKEVPNVVSLSYGDEEASMSRAYQVRVMAETQKLGLRGVSVFFAAGDSGVGCAQDKAGQEVFSPNFPADLPTVTTVGGTTTEGVLLATGEIVNSIGGGGFSNRFPRPAYQEEAVKHFLATAPKQSLPPARYFNATGRAYPDVAALSSGFWVVSYGIPSPVAGTSCASPTFASVTALVNQERIQKGKPSLGFLNPLLYSSKANPTNDIDHGCNMGCSDQLGFCAQAGWDPASGLGSPNYPNFVKAAMA